MRWQRGGMVAVAGLLTACAATEPTELTELDLAAGRWQAAEPAAYRFELRVTCFCPPGYNEWHRIEVVDGSIVSVVNVTDQEPLPADRWHEWYTIDEIFDRIRQFIDSDIFGRVEASYHPALGYPVEANLVAREGIADAGILFRVRAFAALGGP